MHSDTLAFSDLFLNFAKASITDFFFRYRYNKEEDSFARERHSSAKTALGTNLASLVAQMRRTLKTYEHHWKKLSQKVCDDVAEASATCWNGKTVTE